MRIGLFPLHTVLFPGMALALHIFEPRYRRLVNECLETKSPFGVVLIRHGREVGGPAEPHPVGTLAEIAAVERLPDGRLNIEAVGKHRFRLVALHRDLDYLAGTAEPFPLAGATGRSARKLALALRPWLGRYIDLLAEAAETRFAAKALPTHPAELGYLTAIVTQVPMIEKQQLLATAAAAELLQRERAMLRREISLLRAMLASARARDTAPFSPN
jgi:Lon protease-like protein